MATRCSISPAAGFGDAALHRAPLRWFLKPGAVARARRWFERRGGLVIFLSRFMPGLRLPTYFAAGLVRAGLFRFLFWFVLAGVTWTPTLIFLVSLAGPQPRRRDGAVPASTRCGCSSR